MFWCQICVILILFNFIEEEIEAQRGRVTQPVGGKTKFTPWASAQVQGFDPSPLLSHLGRTLVLMCNYYNIVKYYYVP